MQHLKCPVQHLHMSEDTGTWLHAVDVIPMQFGATLSVGLMEVKERPHCEGCQL